jgi:putative ABC transport system permease protein
MPLGGRGVTVRSYFRALARESRHARGRLAFFVACLAVGVAAVVAVAGLAASLDSKVRAEARPLLAADLVIEGRRPLTPELAAGIAELGPGVARADLRELVTVVANPPAPDGTPGRSQLVELKVVAPGYPFYGALTTDPPGELADLLAHGGVLVAPELAARLGLAPGSPLRVGTRELVVRGEIRTEPDRVGSEFGFAVASRLMMGAADFPTTGLEATGSRITYRTLLRLPPGAGREAAQEAKEQLAKLLPETGGGHRIETWAEAQPALRNGLARVERFLGLVALLSLLAGGIGVAQTVRAWLTARLDAVAVLKCLGMRPREVLALYLGQSLGLGLLGSLVGVAGGVALLFLLPAVLGDLVPRELVDPWQLGAFLRGLGLGVGIATLFSLPPLLSVLSVAPARVLRRTVEPLPPSLRRRLAFGLLLFAGIWGTAAVQARSPVLGLQFAAGALLAAGLLTLAARLVARGVSKVPARRFWLRYGLAALGRPGSATLSGVVALGLGVVVVLGMWLIERGLSRELRADLPEKAPSVFLVDVQPGQWSGVEAVLAKAGATNIDSVPVVMARLTAIDGQGAQERAKSAKSDNHRDGSRRWALTREQRLTYLPELPRGNTLAAGTLWSEPEVPEVSVEEEFAQDLGVGLGSRLSFDIQGVPFDLQVTSLRTVDWATFGINFFLIVEPGVLDRAPQQRVAAAFLVPGSEDRVQDELAAGFPNVTMLRIREILEKVIAVLDKISLGMRFLGGFTALAGVAILAGAVSSTAARRGREVALLKTLGLTRGMVLALFAVEHALVGLVAGVLGTGGAAILAWLILTRGMEAPWTFEPLPLALGLVASVALSVTAGLGASLRALGRRPIEMLREG